VNDINVLTPEKVLVSYQQARLGSRAVAAIIDHLLIGAGLFGAAMVLSPIFSARFVGPFLMVLVYVFGYFLYFTLFEGLWNGLTPGKATARIRVRMLDGTPITFPAAIYRALMRLPDLFFPFFFLTGALTIFISEKGQRLGDLAAGTVVINERPSPIPATPSPHIFGIHPLEVHVGDLRGMTRADYLMLKQLADRFPTFHEEVRNKLLREVWEPWSQKHNMPTISGVHPIYVIEAVVMKYGRTRQLL